MSNLEAQLEELKLRISQLQRTQEILGNNINEISKKLESLQAEVSLEDPNEFQRLDDGITPTGIETIAQEKPNESLESKENRYHRVPRTKSMPRKVYAKPHQVRASTSVSSSLESYIGENIINKLGVLILLVGVVIGVKYTIVHDLISPTMRIVLGYITGLLMFYIGLRMKMRFENYSAVLVSGGVAVLYIITYFAYDYYGLLSQSVAFGLMLLLTVTAVYLSLLYDRQTISIIGLVGAYAIPFLLQYGSESLATLFTYIAIINLGILYISLRRKWNLLLRLAIVITWLIFIIWVPWSVLDADLSRVVLFFSLLFFILFYVALIARRLIDGPTPHSKTDVVFLGLNSIIYYAIGYKTLTSLNISNDLIGVFTFFTAFLHFVMAYLIFSVRPESKRIFFMSFGLGVAFLTLSIFLKFDGVWVTLFLSIEGLILFLLGRTQSDSFLEQISYPVIVVSFASLVNDWYSGYGHYSVHNLDAKLRPILNPVFLTSSVVVLALYITNKYFFDRKNPAGQSPNNKYLDVMKNLLPVLLLITLFTMFLLEIYNYWDIRYVDSAIEQMNAVTTETNYIYNHDMRLFGRVWMVLYTMFFMCFISVVNLFRVRSASFAKTNFAMDVLSLVLYLTVGLYALSELRESLLYDVDHTHFKHSSINIGLRYVSYIFVVFILSVLRRYCSSGLLSKDYLKIFDGILYVSLLWIMTSELLSWMDIFHSKSSYKLGVSILWGLYSLFLVAVGIYQQKQYLRLGGIVLFGITLVKLIFYDLADLDSISKTVVFISLGALLLVISYLYYKYQNKISGSNNDA